MRDLTLEEQWTMVGEVLQRAFPDTERNVWDPKRSLRAYRLYLADVEPVQVLVALRAIGKRNKGMFRPSAAAIDGELEQMANAGRPTFAEALVMIRHAIRARPPRGARYDDDPEPEDDQPRPRGWRSAERKRRDAEREAVEIALSSIHPLAATFALRQGVDRLRYLRLDDPEYGEKRRADLEKEWISHVETFGGREVAALAAGERREAGLKRLDPLNTIGLAAPSAQLEVSRQNQIEEAPSS